MDRRAQLAVNLCLYQVGWIAVVGGAATGRAALGALVALGLVGVHLCLVRPVLPEAGLLVAAGLLGLGVDSALLAAGVARFGETAALPSPPWMVVLWIQFATLLHFALGWLEERPLLAAALGLVGGPAAYLTGERLGAMSFPAGWVGPLAVGLLWAAALPTLLLAARRTGLAAAFRYRLPGRRGSGP